MMEIYKGKAAYSKALRILLEGDENLIAKDALPLLEQSIREGLSEEDNVKALIYLSGIHIDNSLSRNYEKASELFGQVNDQLAKNSVLKAYWEHVRDRLGSWGAKNARSIDDLNTRIAKVREVVELTRHPLAYLVLAEAHAEKNDKDLAEKYYKEILNHKEFFHYAEEIGFILQNAQKGLNRLTTNPEREDVDAECLTGENQAFCDDNSTKVRKYSLLLAPVGGIIVFAISLLLILTNSGVRPAPQTSAPSGTPSAQKSTQSAGQTATTQKAGPKTAGSSQGNYNSQAVSPAKPAVAPNSGGGIDQIASTPVHSVGTEYVMESNNVSNPKLSYVAERKVTSVQPDRISVSMRNLKSNYVRTLEYDPQWNLVSVRGAAGEGSDYSPPIKYFDFPLQPGKRWSGVSTERNIKTGGTREHKISAVVGGWETVSVPAGTFQAIKVMINNEVKDLQTGQTTSGTDTSWYAPAAKRSVKSEMTVHNTVEGRDDLQNVALMSYSIK